MRKLFTPKFWGHVASIPFIWAMLLPVVVLHVALEVYQQICFRIYGIELVKITDYVFFDRAKLNYLNWLDKLNCGYCSYVNGAFVYFAEIGHRTEYYWCGIKHSNQPGNPVFEYQEKFAAYGDKAQYEKVCQRRHLKS